MNIKMNIRTYVLMIFILSIMIIDVGATTVTIKDRQILVNGDSFFIKGVVYSPIPIGVDSETTFPYGDYFTSNHASIYNRDLPLLRQMGTNTIRLRRWNNTADHTHFLNRAYNNGINSIYVMASFRMSPSTYNVSSPEGRIKAKTDFRKMVAAHKNNPAILMWVIGNELNAPSMYGNKLNDLFSLIDEMAQEAHLEEGTNYHPVTTPLADINLINTISTYDQIVKNLDVWSVQIYRGATFGSFFNDYSIASKKPVIILEYGIDAYDDKNHNEYENIGIPYQAKYAESLWGEIKNNSNVASGGSIMAYSDEWWKGRYSQIRTGCPDYNASFHSDCGNARSSHPDGYANEEWWGIMRVKNNGVYPDIMQPRTVYNTLKLLWAPPASITNLKNITYERTYINWTWADPGDIDFSKVMVYINGVYKTDVLKGIQYYNVTDLTNNTNYKISTHTVDIYGNINMTWRNHTAKTSNSGGSSPGELLNNRLIDNSNKHKKKW